MPTARFLFSFFVIFFLGNGLVGGFVAGRFLLSLMIEEEEAEAEAVSEAETEAMIVRRVSSDHTPRTCTWIYMEKRFA